MWRLERLDKDVILNCWFPWKVLTDILTWFVDFGILSWFFFSRAPPELKRSLLTPYVTEELSLNACYNQIFCYMSYYMLLWVSTEKIYFNSHLQTLSWEGELHNHFKVTGMMDEEYRRDPSIIPNGKNQRKKRLTCFN